MLRSAIKKAHVGVKSASLLTNVVLFAYIPANLQQPETWAQRYAPQNAIETVDIRFDQACETRTRECAVSFSRSCS